VFDPKGGYFKKGHYTPSLVAELGDVIERHMKKIGLLPADDMDEHRKQFLVEKRAQLESRDGAAAAEERGEFPAEATLCSKCSTKSVIRLDGCVTCLNCGDSKCG
jgi:hypothetical protein